MQGEDTAKEKTQFFRFAELSRSLTYINVGYGGTVATKKSGLMETAISYQARSEHRIHNIRGNRNTLLITFIKLVWVQRYAKATTPPPVKDQRMLTSGYSIPLEASLAPHSSLGKQQAYFASAPLLPRQDAEAHPPTYIIVHRIVRASPRTASTTHSHTASTPKAKNMPISPLTAHQQAANGHIDKHRKHNKLTNSHIQKFRHNQQDNKRLSRFSLCAHTAP